MRQNLLALPVVMMSMLDLGTSSVEESDSLLELIRDTIAAERWRQQAVRAGGMEGEDATGPAIVESPKEISIHCPVPATVQITDLPTDVVRNNECLTLHLEAPDLSLKLLIKCDGKAEDAFFSDDI